ncbi:MAG: hypothetical protein GX877_04745 [Bacteroidales bacterium]|nr:hypothetical protein [Bacteroidales bacterium]
MGETFTDIKDGREPCLFAQNNYNTYGVLYNWLAASTACPDGWHLPSDAEWEQLVTYLDDDAGGKLKEKGTAHWKSPNTGATNETGFTALPGGYLHSSLFYHIGYDGLWWSSTEDRKNYAWYRYLDYDERDVYRVDAYKRFGLSIRCVKD